MDIQDLIRQINEELGSIERDINNVTDGTQDILQGWIEALEYVKGIVEKELV